MAKYFRYFPTTVYSSSDNSSGVDLLTNLMARFKLNDAFKTNASVYYKYDVQDGDTPEIVAYKVYGSVEKHWVILLMNDMVDPQFDWPLDNRSLSIYIDKKYSGQEYANSSVTGAGLTWANQNTHSYYKIITSTYGTTSETQTIEINSSTYANLAASTTTTTLQDGNQIRVSVSKDTKSYYRYEYDLNDEKRQIIILKPEFVFDLENEFRRVIAE